jgi:hypothetical protein
MLEKKLDALTQLYVLGKAVASLPATWHIAVFPTVISPTILKFITIITINK